MQKKCSSCSLFFFVFFLHPSLTCKQSDGSLLGLQWLMCFRWRSLDEFKPHRRAAATHVLIYRLNAEDIEAAASDPKLRTEGEKQRVSVWPSHSVIFYFASAAGLDSASAAQNRASNLLIIFNQIFIPEASRRYKPLSLWFISVSFIFKIQMIRIHWNNPVRLQALTSLEHSGHVPKKKLGFSCHPPKII